MKIKRYREIQSMTFDDYLNVIVDNALCPYCTEYKECLECMGEDNIQAISGCGCSAFDASVEELEKHFLLEKCIKITN